jgi:hypothetical protein
MKPATRCILRTIGIEIALIFLALTIYIGGESDIGAEIFLGSFLIILPFALISFILGYFAGERVVPFEELSPLVRFFLGVHLILTVFWASGIFAFTFAYIIFFPDDSEDAWQYIFIILLLRSIPILVIGIIMGIVLSKMALGNKKIQNSNLKTQNDINECKKEIK